MRRRQTKRRQPKARTWQQEALSYRLDMAARHRRTMALNPWVRGLAVSMGTTIEIVAADTLRRAGKPPYRRGMQRARAHFERWG